MRKNKSKNLKKENLSKITREMINPITYLLKINSRTEVESSQILINRLRINNRNKKVDNNTRAKNNNISNN